MKEERQEALEALQRARAKVQSTSLAFWKARKEAEDAIAKSDKALVEDREALKVYLNAFEKFQTM